MTKTRFSRGLEILAFPCNQFGGQKPGTNEQIVEFACTRFKVEYPIFDKVFGLSDAVDFVQQHLKDFRDFDVSEIANLGYGV
ncbi:hypothetical protein Syun_019912 [Stephania yunnanensis]|uniref:Glutathione peroxidase n=1 Tax=Stephania yunnanensis TaxID=152371 RepID=A0AAP0IW63_9MAGN